VESVTGTADLRSQVQIGKDYRVETRRMHTFLLQPGY
jgi:hypothetical protein